MATASSYRYNLVYSLILFTCILLLSMFFGYVQCCHRNRSALKHTQILSNISYFMVAISICFYLDIAFYLSNNITHIITNSSCRIGMIGGILILTLHKAAMYLFIAIRAQILQSLQSLQIHSNCHTHSFKISLILILIYILIIIYNISEIVLHPRDTILTTHGLCTSTSTLQLLISQFAADLIIGVYCMTVFLLRLRMLLNSDGNGKDETFDVTLKKLMFYSSIPILASVLVYPSGIALKILYPHSNGSWAFKLDIFVDVYCVVMQVMNHTRRGHNQHNNEIRTTEIHTVTPGVSDESNSPSVRGTRRDTLPKLVRDTSERSIHDKSEWD
eukprot:257189_1